MSQPLGGTGVSPVQAQPAAIIYCCLIVSCAHRRKDSARSVGVHLRVRLGPGRTHRSAPTVKKLPVWSQFGSKPLAGRPG
jgi:hypothetical protein